MNSNNLYLETKLLLKTKVVYLMLIISALLIFFGMKQSFGFLNDFQDTFNKLKSSGADSSKAIDFIKNTLYGLSRKNAFSYSLLIIYSVLPLLFSVLSAQFIGLEFTNRTARIKAIHIGWGQTVLSKIIIVFLSIAFSELLFALIGVITNNIFWMKYNQSLNTFSKISVPAFNQSVFLQIGCILLGTFFYSLISMIATLVSRSQLFGAITGIAIPFIESYADKLLFSGSLWFIPRNLYGILVTKNFTFFNGSLVGIPPINDVTKYNNVMTTLILVLWCLVGVIIAFQVSKRQSL